MADVFAGVPWRGPRHPVRRHLRPLDHYGTDARVTSVMVEIRRDLYLDEPSTIEPDGFDDLVGRLAGCSAGWGPDRRRTKGTAPS